MRTATAVIGANYGDEGKGLVVDALSGGSDTVVVRFNGGAQAGHTVVTPEGDRHVFHHHGAGTFRGAATYLSEHFILNPLLFAREHRQLGYPRVMVSPNARVTTPYDMMLNQWAEEDRGTARHGSCGLGINETVTRYNAYDVRSLTARGMLHEIRHEYVPARMVQLEIEMTPARHALLTSAAVVQQYEFAYGMMQAIVSWRDACDVEGTIVFEGAQGLLLDEDAYDFPYVTRSKTGLYNVRALCEHMGITELHATFVTRTYLTRHGAGPMPTEDASMSFPDATNVPNPWQYSLRFGTLDVPALLHRVDGEVAGWPVDGLLVRPSIAMTCVDQMDNDELRASCPFPLSESRGPTRLTFRSV